MRLWTIHPKFLDSKGLVALWREGLLAKAVLENKTKGYKNHPQLIRFRDHSHPVEALSEYLRLVLVESQARGFCFDASKIPSNTVNITQLEESRGQLDYEWQHLLKKLKIRDPNRYHNLSQNKQCPQPHPLFTIVPGGIKSWERIT